MVKYEDASMYTVFTKMTSEIHLTMRISRLHVAYHPGRAEVVTRLQKPSIQRICGVCGVHFEASCPYPSIPFSFADAEYI